jgi:hypothetical protein
MAELNGDYSRDLVALAQLNYEVQSLGVVSLSILPRRFFRLCVLA